MLDKERLQETAMQVRDLTPATLSELTGIPQRRLARFVNNPESVTFPELTRIENALRFVREARCLECGDLLEETAVANGIEYHEGCA